MVQQEVADRMAARPGNKDYGAFTVKLALHAQVLERFNVAPGSFFPPPRVTSTVIKLQRHDAGLDPAIVQAACTMADAAFTTRRKTIANSCRTYFSGRNQAVQVEALLKAAEIDPTRRGETLDTSEYIALGQAFLDQGFSG